MDDRADRALEANGVASAMMSEHQKQTEFLRQCLRYDETVEQHELEERITRLQRDEICVRRAVWLMALFAALAMAGLCYAAVFVPGHPLNLSEYTGRLIIKLFCALGVGSLICLLAFVGLGIVYRKELDQRREECRRLATKLLESRLGKPLTPPSSTSVKEQPALLIVPASKISETDGEQMKIKNESNIMTKTPVNAAKALNVFGLILSLSAAALIGGLTGCAGNRHTQSTSERTDDKADSSRVRRALSADTQYKYGDVTVQTFKGVVQLSGFVNSRDQKKRAGDLAKNVDGVRGVENNITVKESAN
jgi:hypothetical protein